MKRAPAVTGSFLGKSGPVRRGFKDAIAKIMSPLKMRHLAVQHHSPPEPITPPSIARFPAQKDLVRTVET